MKIYLSGPMTGYEQLNKPAFDTAAEALRAAGYEVISPAESPYNTLDKMPREVCMRADFHHVLSVEAIALLPGWQGSMGAQAEVTVGREIGLLIAPFEMFLKYTIAVGTVENNVVRNSPIVRGQPDFAVVAPDEVVPDLGEDAL